MDTDTCITNFPTSDEFKCENAESRLRENNKDAFLFNLTMNPQRDPDKKRIGEWTFFSSPEGKDRRKMSVVKYEKERRKALDGPVDTMIQILKECRQKLSLEGGGRMQRRRKRKRKKKRTQKRRRKKRKRRTRR